MKLMLCAIVTLFSISSFAEEQSLVVKDTVITDLQHSLTMIIKVEEAQGWNFKQVVVYGEQVCVVFTKQK